MYISGIIVAFSAVVATFVLRRYLVRREKLVLFSRDKITDQEIYDRYYKRSTLDKDSVLFVWHGIATCLKVDPGLLRPTDEFGKAIGKNWLTNDVLEGLEQYARDRMKALGRKVDLSDIKTVDDFVKAFA
jgi:hypothetical protein